MKRTNRSAQADGITGPVVLIGPLPPPTHGAAKNTAIIADLLQQRGIKVVKSTDKGIGFNRNLAHHLRRCRRNLMGPIRLVGTRIRYGKGTALYIVAAGDFGLVYTLMHVMVARVIGVPVVMHHRTYSCIDEKSRLMLNVNRLLDHRSFHVFLSNGMLQGYSDQYQPLRARPLVFSNAGLNDVELADSSKSLQVTDPIPDESSGSTLRLGHLANLSRSKGLMDVIELYENTRKAGVVATLDIAGQPVDDESRVACDTLAKRYPDHVKLLGHVSGEKKQAFYREIDIFLFPTRYRKEAQPNVIFEAIASGNLVAAFNRGCIAEMLPPNEALQIVIEKDCDFAIEAVHWITDRHQDLEKGHLSELRSQMIQWAAQQTQEGRQHVEEFLSLFYCEPNDAE